MVCCIDDVPLYVRLDLVGMEFNSHQQLVGALELIGMIMNINRWT